LLMYMYIHCCQLLVNFKKNHINLVDFGTMIGKKAAEMFR